MACREGRNSPFLRVTQTKNGLFQTAKSVYSFKPYFEEEWAEIQIVCLFIYFKIEEAS